MRVGMTIFNQNYEDWDRYEADEHGQDVPPTPQRRDVDIFREELALAIEADSLGFDSVWTVEHHFTPYTMVTNPLQWLTYLAGVTKNVDLGTMVIVLPWHNPVRVAEDLNMLQTFLGPNRRVIAGLGRGIARREYAGLNVDQNLARPWYDESIQIITSLLRDGAVTFPGRFFNVDKLRLRPAPERDMSDLIYSASGSPETMEIMGKTGVRPLIIPSQDLATSLQGLHAYNRMRADAGFEPTDTKLALWTYVAETEEEARAGAEEYMTNYADSALRHYELLHNYHKDIKGYERYQMMNAMLAGDQGAAYRKSWAAGHPWGTPEQVIEMVKQRAAEFGASEITFVFAYGGMPIEKAQKSMRLFAEKVMPEIKKITAKPIELLVSA